MRYRMLALDLDETLLDENLEISGRNKRAIRAAARRGVMVVIATGRMFRTSLPYVRELKLNTDWPMISYHGALIKTTESRRVLYHHPLPCQLAVSIIDQAERDGYYVNLCLDDRLYIREENEYSRYYRSIAGIDLAVVGPLATFLEKRGEDPTKLTIINWEGKLDEIGASLRRQYGEKLVALQSRPYFLDITACEATKERALKRLAALAGVRREEIIAFGDSDSDLDMIRFAGLGVAVANAQPAVLQAADLVTAANTEDGVARVIEAYILGSGGKNCTSRPVAPGNKGKDISG